jgi:hypothetical protein
VAHRPLRSLQGDEPALFIVIPQQVTLTSINRLQEPEHPQMSGLTGDAPDINLGTLATKRFTGRKFAGKKCVDD